MTVEGQGVYRGKVTKVTAAGVYVLVPDIHPTVPLGPCQHMLTVSEGDAVLVADVGDSPVTPDLIVLGVIS